MPSSLIQANDITCSFHDNVIISHTSFNVDKGDVITLECPKYDGLTSVLKLIAGYYKPNKGQIYYFGQHIRPKSYMLRQNIIYIGHNVMYNASRNVGDNIMDSLRIKAMHHSHSLRDMQELLSWMDAPFFIDTPMMHLSQSQILLFALIRAFMLRPSLYVIDSIWPLLNNTALPAIATLLHAMSQQDSAVISANNSIFTPYKSQHWQLYQGYIKHHLMHNI